MIFTGENILLIGSILLFSSILAGKTGYRFGVPALLIFLFVGMIFGSDGFGLKFENAKYTQMIGMLALSIILYSGGMETKIKEIRPVLIPGIVLSTAGVLLTTIFTGLFIWYIGKLPFLGISLSFTASLLLAATMSSTDSASVFGILRMRKTNLKNNLRPLLELESGSNDPMAYVLTIIFVQILQSAEHMGTFDIILVFFVQLIVGCLAGYFIGKLTIWVMNVINVQNKSLYPILLLAFVFFTFSFTDLIKGNGYLAVYIAGIMVGNARIIQRRDINTFMDGLTWLFQIIMFLCLGLLVNPKEMFSMALPALLIGIFMILLARPISVSICMLPFGQFDKKSRMFVSWVGLRGAVPIILATYPVVAEIEGSSIIFNIVFFITILSLLVQGTSISAIANLLDLSLPMQKEGNEFGIELPEEIDSELNDLVVTEDLIAKGNRLMDLNLPKGTLVMIIKRDSQYIVPNGSVELKLGDQLLLISDSDADASSDLDPDLDYEFE